MARLNDRADLMLDFRENPDDGVLTVSQLTARVRGLIEGNFGQVAVTGEISNYRPSVAGHVYFSLKDAGASLEAVIWRSTAARLTFAPKTGDKVIARGEMSVYPARGQYQLMVNSLRPQGAGDARAALEALVKKLRAEGLFAPEAKKDLPAIAWTIGLVTSPTGAAVQDMIKVIHKRLPCARMILSPCRVQGAGAGPDIARALAKLDHSGLCDVIIFGRGGGSEDDLSAFNDETLARAVHACRTPVISAIGHEIDNTVAELVADVRAATPSEAAEYAACDYRGLRQAVRVLQARLAGAMAARAAGARREVERVGRDLARRHPLSLLRQNQQRCDEAARDLARGVAAAVAAARGRLAVLSARLEAISPLAVLRRGYGIVRGPGGQVVRRPQDAPPGTPLRIDLAEGALNATVD